MYIPQKSRYSLPNEVYMQVIYIFKSYDHHLLEAERILHETTGSGEKSVIPTKSSMPSDVVATKVRRREKHLKRVKLIDSVIDQLPEEYRKPVKNKLIYNIPYPKELNQSKAKEYRRRVMWLLAVKLCLVEP